MENSAVFRLRQTLMKKWFRVLSEVTLKQDSNIVGHKHLKEKRTPRIFRLCVRDISSESDKTTLY
jgi:hypothetical protein